MRRWEAILCIGFGLLTSGCPKGKPDYDQGKKRRRCRTTRQRSPTIKKAAKANPFNASYKIN